MNYNAKNITIYNAMKIQIVRNAVQYDTTQQDAMQHKTRHHATIYTLSYLTFTKKKKQLRLALSF